MAKELYYIDTCIWLNLINKEKGYLKDISIRDAAERLIVNVLCSNDKYIFYSSIILRELELKTTKNDFQKIRTFLSSSRKFIRIDVTITEKNLARKLESKYDFIINYYDLIHMILTKKINCILITRDRLLIKIAEENNVICLKPEEIINY